MSNKVTNADQNLNLSAIRRVFRRNRGAIRDFAATLELSHSTISRWLDGHVTSARIAKAAPVFVKKIQQAKRAA